MTNVTMWTVSSFTVFNEDLAVRAMKMSSKRTSVSWLVEGGCRHFIMFYEDFTVRNERFRRRVHLCPVRSKRFRCDTVFGEDLAVRAATIALLKVSVPL